MAVLLVAAALCEPPLPAPAVSPLEALDYLEVGDAERAAGSLDTAQVAYAEALRLDPSSDRARLAWLAACVEQHGDALLAEGRRLLDEGDRPGALALFERLRSGRSDPAVDLFEGIALYEEGDDERARPLLLEAARSAAWSARAQYFLGLIGLRDGAGAEAASLFERVELAGSGGLVERAAVLRQTALRTGRGVVSVFAESGYDSNVTYAADSQPAPTDGALGAGLFGQLRPLGLSGPYLRASAFLRQQLQVHEGDLGVFGGQAGYRLGRGETYGLFDYGYELTRLGGSNYLSAHRFRAGGRWLPFGRFSVAGVYALRLGSYLTAGSSAYSGVLHSLSPEVSYRFPLGSSMTLGYDVFRDATQLAETSSWEHGPRAGMHLLLRPTLRASVESGVRLRNLDGGPVQGVAAVSSTVYFGSVAAEQDFGRLTVRLLLGARASSSSDAANSWTRMTATLGVSYTAGIF